MQGVLPYGEELLFYLRPEPGFGSFIRKKPLFEHFFFLHASERLSFFRKRLQNRNGVIRKADERVGAKTNVMKYEIRTLEEKTVLYRMNRTGSIDMEAIRKYQSEHKPSEEEKHWAYSLYFCPLLDTCSGYVCESPILIQITLLKPIRYIFTDDPFFSASGYKAEERDKYMKEMVIPTVEKLIGSGLRYPEQPFMKSLGEHGYAFRDVMNDEAEEEIIIPHTLLGEDSFAQEQRKYKLVARGKLVLEEEPAKSGPTLLQKR